MLSRGDEEVAAHGAALLAPGFWSSMWMPAAPFSMDFSPSFIVAVKPPWPVSASATIGLR